MTINTLTFKPFSNFSRGTIFDMLLQSYATNPELVEQDRDAWEAYDNEVFANLDGGIGKSGFISCKDDIPIGFASWDPRNKPEYAVIGHNCILPEYQGKGYGKAQIEEVLKRLKQMGFKLVKVSTGAGSFFLPSENMYKSCGFREVDRMMHDSKPDFEVTYFEKLL